MNVEEEFSPEGEGMGWREGGERVRCQQHRQRAMCAGRTEASEEEYEHLHRAALPAVLV